MGDFARIVVDAFVMRREHGSAVSSLDQALVLKWERQGVPLGVVLDAVDEAFRKRREPPASLTDCARQVQAAFAKWALGADASATETPAIPATSAAVDPATASQPALPPTRNRPVAVALRASAAQTADPRGRAALKRLATEVEAHFGLHAAFDAVDEASVLRAFGAIAWSSLTDEERAQIDATARAAIPVATSPRYAAAMLAEHRVESTARRIGVGLPLLMR
jgi:hypothetical protein